MKTLWSCLLLSALGLGMTGCCTAALGTENLVSDNKEEI